MEIINAFYCVMCPEQWLRNNVLLVGILMYAETSFTYVA